MLPLRAAAASLVVAVALVAGAGCPPPPPPPPDPPKPVVPLDVTVSIAPGAPEPDAGDPPPTDGILPEGAPANVAVFDLGLLAVENGSTGDIVVDVTAGLGSMTVIAYGHEGAHVILERAQDPDGALVVSDIEPSDLPAEHLAFARGFPAQVFSINRVLASAGSGAFLVPNTPAVEPLDGRWLLRVGQYAVDLEAVPRTRAPVDRPVRVVVLVRGQDTGRGALDLNLHFTGGDLTAASAPDDGVLQGALDVVRDAFGGAGIEIRDVRMRDIDNQFATCALAEGRCESGDLDALAAQGAGAPPGIDLFFVDTFVCILNGGVDVGSAIGGIASGIPGLPWVHGSAHSGVAVSTSFAGDDPRPLGVVMAHELGHFLGLYHSRESSLGAAPIYDEIADTPDDDDARANLMFFAADDDITLSADQGRVLRTSAFVEPVISD